jgi:hypothetical protein
MWQAGRPRYLSLRLRVFALKRISVHPAFVGLPPSSDFGVSCRRGKQRLNLLRVLIEREDGFG